MNLSRESMLDVMAYVDGELDGEALDRVESLLATDEDASRLALELRTLGDCVRVIQTDRVSSKNPDEIADDVMKAIGSNVVQLAPLAIRRRNAMIAGGVSTLLAIAAGWLLFFSGPNTTVNSNNAPVAQANGQANGTASAAPTALTPQQPEVPEQMAAQAAGQAGADVESLESPSHEVSVFYVPSTASANPNASTVVVWIGEGDTK